MPPRGGWLHEVRRCGRAAVCGAPARRVPVLGAHGIITTLHIVIKWIFGYPMACDDLVWLRPHGSLGAGGLGMDGWRAGWKREGGDIGERDPRDGGGGESIGESGRTRLALTEVGLEMEMGRLSLSHGGG